mmetsp:Transcript_6062/g.14406  ORF Transcript_6062/g.14406 Transcript_6062/m.14406 type:complete len:798 (-) Transcript_6062:82-2475(-)
MAQAVLQDDPVVDLKVRQMSSAVNAQKKVEEEVLTRQQVQDFLISERARVRFCGTLPLTVCIWFVFTATAWSHGNVEQTARAQSMIRDAIEGIEVQHQISSLQGQPVAKRIRLANISMMEEVWTWMLDGFIPLFAGSHEEPGVLRKFNQVIRPGIQLRQRRVADVDCPVVDELRQYFRADCRSLTGSLALRFGPEVNNTGPDFIDRSFVAGGGIQVAVPTWKPNPEELFYAFLRIHRVESNNSMMDIHGILRARELWSHGWLDDATDYLQVSVTVLNPDIRSFIHVQLIINFVRGGLVQPLLEVRSLPTQVWISALEIVVDVVWGLLIVLLFILAFQEMAEGSGSCSHRCCGSFWLLVDWASMLVGSTLLGFFFVYNAGMDGLDQHMANLPVALSQYVPTTTLIPIDPVVLAERKYAEEVTEEGWQAQFQEDVDLMIFLRVYHRLGMFWYVALILLRFFRGFAGQPRIATIGRTIGQAASDLGHLGLMVAVAFCNLALGGYLVFGPELEAWSSIEKAIMTTISILFGQGDLGAMYNIAPISTLLWGSAYLICIIILMMSMISAILISHHREVRKKRGRAQQTLPQQFVAMLEDFVWKRSYDLRMLLRFVKSRSGPRSKILRVLPALKPETKRIARIPYDDLIDFFDSSDESKAALPSWAPVKKEDFYRFGVDSATTARIMKKCRVATSANPDQEMPVMRLFEEFQTSIQDTCAVLDFTGEELKSWVAERRVDMANVEPRQRKLEGLSRALEPAEPVFALETHYEEEETPALEEGPGNGQAIADASPHAALENGPSAT